MSELIETVETPIFTKKRHELQTLLNSIKKITPKALEVLEAALESESEKIRMDAVKVALGAQESLQKAINSESLNRLVLDVKLNGVTKNLSTVDDSMPKLSFDTISPEFADVQVVDMSATKSIG